MTYQVGNSKVSLADHGRAAWVLRVSVENALHMLESSTSERAHIEAETKEVCVKERSHKAVAPEKCTEHDSGKDGNLCVGDKAHRRVIVGLDPTLDDLSRLDAGRLRLSLALSPSAGRRLRLRGRSHGWDHGGSDKGEHVEERESHVGHERDCDR